MPNGAARPLLPALLLGLLAACAPAAVVAGAGGPSGGVVLESASTGWRTKEVVSKRAPETLVARDGTICRVSPDRFRDTATGAMVHCNWQ